MAYYSGIRKDFLSQIYLIFKVQTFFIYNIYMTFNEYFNLNTFSAVAEDQDPDYERPNS